MSERKSTRISPKRNDVKFGKINEKKPFVVIKGADVSEMRFGARSYVMTFYPNRHLFLLYDFTDGTPPPEPIQIKVPAGIQNYLLLQDKRIATFSHDGYLYLWSISQDGHLKAIKNYQIFKKKNCGLEIFESNDGTKLFCKGHLLVAVCDLKTGKLVKYDISKDVQVTLLDQGKLTYLLQLEKQKQSINVDVSTNILTCFELSDVKTYRDHFIFDVEGHHYETIFNIKVWNGIDKVYLTSMKIIIEITFKDEKLTWTHLNLKDLNIYNVPPTFGPFFLNTSTSNLLPIGERIYDRSKSLTDKNLIVNLHYHPQFSYRHNAVVLLSNGANIILNICDRKNDKMLNYQYLTDSKETVTSGIDFSPQRTVYSGMKCFVCNGRVIDLATDIVRLRKLMDFYMPDGIMREILFYI